MYNWKKCKKEADLEYWIERKTKLIKSGQHKKRGKCPFHKESTASFFYYPSTNSWFCYGACKRGGSVIEFIMESENVDRFEAYRMAMGIGEENEQHRERRRATEAIIDHEEDKEPDLPDWLLSRVIEWSDKLWSFKAPSNLHQIANGYLMCRGISRKWGMLHTLGFTGIDSKLKEPYVTSTGETYNLGYLQNMISIPYFVGGDLVGVRFRLLPKLDNGKRSKYTSFPGSVVKDAYYNVDVLKTGENPVYIVEAELCAAMVNSQRDRNCTIGLPSSGFLPKHAFMLIGKTPITLLDNDEAGFVQEAKIKAAIARTIVGRVPLPAKDPSESFELDLDIPLLHLKKR